MKKNIRKIFYLAVNFLSWIYIKFYYLKNFNKPKVLILDEFTSSLDNSTEEKILNEISLLKKDKIIIIISHKLSTLSLCDKIFKLEKQTLFQTK